MNCCTNQCNQVRNCPIRAFHEAQKTPLPPITGHSETIQTSNTSESLLEVDIDCTGHQLLSLFLLIYAVCALIAYCLL